MQTVYVFDTNTWLHRQLTQCSGTGITLVSDAHAAETLIYPIPAWPEGEAPGLLRRIPVTLRSRLFVYSTDDRPLLWAPGVYASAPRSRAQAGPFRGGHYLVHHSIEAGGLTISYTDPATAARLWSFVGSVANCPRVRAHVVGLDDPRSLRADTSEWHRQTRWNWQRSEAVKGQRAFREYQAALRDSLFVACPRGVGPSSMRIFEAMQAGRCPVIISDEWLPPPLVDWSACSIQITEAQVQQLPQRLRQHEHRGADLGRRARLEWERWFAPGRVLDFLVAACNDIRASRQSGMCTRAAVATRCLASRAAVQRARRMLPR